MRSDDRLGRDPGGAVRLCLLVFAGYVLTFAAGGMTRFCLDRCIGRPHGGDTLSVRRDTVRDTTVVEIRDTVPVVRRERVVRYVPLEPLSMGGAADTTAGATAGDSVGIVQREYSDDSTYTAWVSGLRYLDYPRLDSITVRQREVVTKVTETVTLRYRQSRWSIGLQAGYGYGLQYRGFEPYVGVGVTYRIFPP